MAAPSIRLRCLRAIRDALDPLFPEGRCQLWRQSGNPTFEAPTAVVRVMSDTPKTETIGRRYARIEREMTIAIDIFLQVDDEDPVDPAADEVVDEATMAVEGMLPQINWAPIFGDSVTMVRLVETLPFQAVAGQGQFGSTIRCALDYMHRNDDLGEL